MQNGVWIIKIFGDKDVVIDAVLIYWNGFAISSNTGKLNINGTKSSKRIWGIDFAVGKIVLKKNKINGCTDAGDML